jgi:hypothetical protein
MNTETGAIYRSEQDIAAAQARGEPLAFVSERVARAVAIGTRALDRKKKVKTRRKMAKQSRRRNR